MNLSFINESELRSNLTASFDDEPYEYYDAGGEGYYDFDWWAKFVFFMSIYTITFVVGLFGNLLVIFSICYLKKLQSTTNLFLVSLATADLLLITICLPIKITDFFTHHWIFGHAMCKIYNYLQFFTAICSVLNLTIMSLERYLAILHPLKAKYTCTKRRARFMICFIWSCSFILATPVIFGKRVEEIGLIHKVLICKREWGSDMVWILFEVYRTTILLILPLIVMTISYSCICIELWKMPSTRRKLTGVMVTPRQRASSGDCQVNFKKKSESILLTTPSGDESTSSKFNDLPKKKSPSPSRGKLDDDEMTRKQIIKMLLCVVCIFFVCWSPIIVNNLLVSVEVLPALNFGYLWHVRITILLMSYVNSCVNPIVYALMSKNFREGFKQIFNNLFCSRSNQDSRRGQRASLPLTGNGTSARWLMRQRSSTLLTTTTSQQSNQAPRKQSEQIQITFE